MQKDSKMEWTQQRLQEMIDNNAEENIHLDFKGGDALPTPISDGKKQDICKDVSAFANSDGGVLIYGITEVDHKADSFSFVDGNSFTKERLEQIINDGIQRRIDGIIITPVRVDGDIKKTVYVLDIPVSPLAPHMIKNKRYYKRFNFQSVQMEEYEVRQTFERKQNSKLVIGDILYEFGNPDSWYDEKSFDVDMDVHVENIGQAIAENYKLVIHLKIGPDGEGFRFNYDRSYVLTKQTDLSNILSTSSSIPIYPGEHVNGMKIGLVIPWIYEEILKGLEIKVTLLQIGGREEETIKPAEFIHDLIMRNINEDYRLEKKKGKGRATEPGPEITIH
jgi:hypothetical protein